MSAVAPAVEAVVDAGGPHVRPLMAALERRLAELAAGHGAPLADHGGATIAAGGKRLRPLAAFVAAGEGEPDGLLRAGVAVELIHSATLVHDDVLDAAQLRRGRATVVAAAGREMATATGDLLFSRAFAELAANRRPDEIRVLSLASSALARGELLQRADAWDPTVTPERYELRCRLKTARLFEAACRLGAMEAPPGSPAAGAADELGRFGDLIGLAFQLLDDVLDVTGPSERTGKPRGADLLDGTVTLPFILARAHDPELAGLAVREITGAAEAEALCRRIEATGALAQARGRALELVAAATGGLPALPPAQRAALELIAAGVVERYA